MSAALPIPIASTSKLPVGAAASPHASASMHGSYSQFALAMSPASFKANPALLASSIDMEHGSLIKTLRGQDAGFFSEDMCRDYTCCGLILKDLHALVDHFEEAHVVVVDPPSSPTADCFSAGGFDLADDMDLDDPESMAPTPTSAVPADSFAAQSILVQRGAGLTPSSPAGFSPYPRVRDVLRRFQDYSTEAADCVVPELLFSPSVTPSPSGSRDGSPDPNGRRDSYGSSSGDDTPSTPTARTIPAPGSRDRAFITRAAGMIQASDLPPPRPKPFRCPKPGCSKAYKQANGLKYHLTHGQCNFAPLDPNSDELKPYICQAGCGKRFKNMSGLRYHYLHSSHGQQGLELLDAGKHP